MNDYVPYPTDEQIAAIYGDEFESAITAMIPTLPKDNWQLNPQIATLVADAEGNYPPAALQLFGEIALCYNGQVRAEYGTLKIVRTPTEKERREAAIQELKAKERTRLVERRKINGNAQYADPEFALKPESEDDI